MTDSGKPDFGMTDFGINGLIQLWKQQRDRAHIAAAMSTAMGSPAVLLGSGQVGVNGLQPKPLVEGVPVSDEVAAEIEIARPELLFGAVVEKRGKTTEGDIIVCFLPAYRWFLEELERDPHAFYQLDSGKCEELTAARYERDGWEAILTRRSRDGGRDVIATRKDLGLTIRIIDQVKLYKPDHPVGIVAVRSLMGVLNEIERGTSKAVITTTSRFTRTVYKDFAHAIPGRLELRDGKDFRGWLLSDLPNVRK